MKLLALILPFVVQGAFASPMDAKHINCLRSTDARLDQVDIQQLASGSREVNISSLGGWTLNTNKILDVDFEVRGLKFVTSDAGCRQKDATNAFPALCHLGSGDLELTGANGEKHTISLYFAMIRISPMTLDDMYDTLDKEGYLARLTFATKFGHDVTLTAVFRTEECSLN